MSQPVLEVSGLSRTYPGVRALAGVGFAVPAGAVHALLGENGAGKSTLIRLVSGAELPTEGSMRLAGDVHAPASPAAALAAGVSTLYQEQTLLPGRSVVANVMLGERASGLRLLSDRRGERATTRAALERVGAGGLDLDAAVESLSVADRQMVGVARALHRRAKLLIMDEPTAALSSREVDALFRVITALPAQGVAVVLVSHRMEEIFRVCTSVTVLRDGHHVLTRPVAGLSPDDLVTAMVGDTARTELPPRAAAPSPVAAADSTGAAPRLRVRDLSGPGFSGVGFDVAAGEVVALAGVTGSGKEAVGSALVGGVRGATGTVQVDGARVRLTPRATAAAGLVGVPADRAREGVLTDLSVAQNLLLPSLSSLTSPARVGFLDARRGRDLARRRVEELNIKAASPAVLVSTLSGGNQQKVALGKWLERAPRVLVLVEPTQGIDIGVRYDFYRLLRRLADEGASVVLISSDVQEVLTLAERVVVMRGGEVTDELAGGDVTAEQLVRATLGESAGESTEALRALDDVARSGRTRDSGGGA